MIRFDFALLPKDARKVVAALRGKNLGFWIVGGYVRDWLSGCTPTDVDVAASGSPWGLKKLLHGQLILCRHTIVNYGKVQITPLRKEQLQLENRDFTVNAIAIDKAGKIVDPFCGVSDVKDRLFRMLSRQGLEDDPVRMLRGCRLAARLDWKMEPDTARAFLELGEKKHIWNRCKLRPRLGLELRKAFDDRFPSRFFECVRGYGMLEHIFPLLHNLWNSEPEQAQKALAECDAIAPGQWSERMAAILKYALAEFLERPGKTAVAFLQDIRWDMVTDAYNRKRQSISAEDLTGAVLLGKDGCTDKSALLELCNMQQSVGTITGIMRAVERIFGQQAGTGELMGARQILKKIGYGRDHARNVRRNALCLLGWERNKIREFLDRDKKGAREYQNCVW